MTSGAQAVGDIHFDDLQFQRRYRGQAAYNQSKLANVLFAYELARRLEGSEQGADTSLYPPPHPTWKA